MQALSTCPHLVELSVNGSALTDVGLLAVGGMPELAHLYHRDCAAMTLVALRALAASGQTLTTHLAA